MLGKQRGKVVQFRAGDLEIMRIGIITAMPEETRAVVRALGGAKKALIGSLAVHHGHRAGHEIVIVESGMGFNNAATAAENLVHEVRPDMIISAGFCGGVSAELQVGDVVVATGLTIISENVQEEVPVEIPAVSRNFVVRQAVEGHRVFAGLFASTPAIMLKSRLAALLPSDAPFPVVEMESAAIAIIAVENGIPFTGIRAVSDPFDEELGFSLNEFCDDGMRIRIPRVLLTIARKPRIIPQLIRLARNSQVAGACLSQAMERLLLFM
jgi:adenosylhomocysteine nucleosidase